MKAFVVYPTYRVEKGAAYVYLYGRQEDGKTFLTRNRFRPYFYIRQKNQKAAQKLAPQADIKECSKKDFDDAPLSCVTLDNPKDVPELRDMYEEEGILTYEADIRFVYRFMMDHGIQGSMEIIGEPQQHNFVDNYYEEPRFSPATWKPDNLKVLSIDIETGKKGKQLYCVSLVGNDGYSKVLFVSDKPVKNTEVFKTEKECLQRFTAAVREYDPDIITGWSVVDYDLRVLQQLCDANHVPFIIGRSDDKVKLRLESHYMRESTAETTGRVILDGIQLLRISFIKLEDYKLGTAAADILGEEKLFAQDTKMEQIEESYRHNKELLAEYNRKDSELVLRILRKKKLIELTIQRSLLTGMQLDRVKASIASLDSVYLRELDKRGYAARTLTHQEKEQGITGGFVMESKPGIYDYVIVCDFKSLYPSIMRTLNIDPLSHVPDSKLKKSTDKFVVAENGAVFKNTDGILPSILDRLHAAREETRKSKDEVARYAVKVLMNSFFGALASPQSRFFNMDVANAITITGQSIIKRTQELIKDMGYDVIYGDTDSIFVHLDVDSQEAAEKLGSEIQKKVNKFYDEWIPKHYHRESRLELAFDKTFVRFYMPMTRSGEGSKKRYAGLRIEDGKERIDFTGLEFVRRDWTDLAKDFQWGILDRIFHKKDVTVYVKETLAALKAGKLDDKLVYRKALRKGIEGYTKTTPPHVKAAALLPEITSTIIEYVMTTKGPQPVGHVKDPIDYEHYIEKQMKPLADSVLVFYDTKFDDLVKGNKQKNLFQY